MHERFMQRAIELAHQGLGHTQSNPLVGCVIVHQNNIIGEGYHHKFGGPHAEIVALSNVKNKALLSESTMYVTLEPCSHYGKTPPCTQTIIAHKIPRIVISTTDPNPIINGRGVQQLTEAGIIVKTGILEKEYRFINRRFFTFHEKKRPYIILKWAQSKDGFLAPDNIADNKQYWISNPTSKVLVHKWRSEEMAILVGAKTVINDNPQLTVRLWKGNNPTRIIIQNHSKIPSNANVLNLPPATIIFTTNTQLNYPNQINTVVLPKENFLSNLLYHLYQLNIISVIVEGGLYTLQQFIQYNLWDEARIITGNKIFYKGIPAPYISSSLNNTFYINNDVLSIIYNYNYQQKNNFS